MASCIFCRIVTREEPARIVYEDSLFLAFLDKNPAARGHIQLIPKKHYQWVWEVPEMAELFRVCQKIIHGIIPALGADHVTIATFGRQVTHAHVWIVPQYDRRVVVTETKRITIDADNQQQLQSLLSEAISREVS